MFFKKITLRSNLPENILTEIMYEIASARVDGAELLRVNISNEEYLDVPLKKRYSILIRLLKKMKDT